MVPKMRVDRGDEVGGASPPRPLVMETGATLTHNAPLFNTIPPTGLQTIRRTELLSAVPDRHIALARADCGRSAPAVMRLVMGTWLQGLLQGRERWAAASACANPSSDELAAL